MAQHAEHHASVTVNAPVEEVYSLFTHFNDFPKFMSFVKEVTYYDDQRSHWVADVGGTHEWDAVNEDWIPGQQIGWRSTSGLENTGKVKFMPVGQDRTMVDVYINYVPPAGVLGATVEKLGFDTHFDNVLQNDLHHFAHMVEEAPRGAHDPMQSHYLFHEDSAVARGQVTDRQKESMAHDPMMSPQALDQREATLRQEQEQAQAAWQQQRTEQERLMEQRKQAEQEQEAALRHQAELDRQAAAQARAAAQEQHTTPRQPDPVLDTLGGRNAAMERTAIGDQDARSERFPAYHQDPMTSRAPAREQAGPSTPVSESEIESPWRNAIRGTALGGEPQSQEPANATEGQQGEEKENAQ